MRYDAFIGGSYESQSPLADCERTVNWYPEVLEADGATAKRVLYPVPGFTLLNVYDHDNAYTTTWRDNPGRGHCFVNGREFTVYGPQLIEVDRNGTPYSVGSVQQDSNPVTFSSNGDAGNQLFITSGGNGYIFDLTDPNPSVSQTALSPISALTGRAHFGAFLDGYFLALDANTSTLYWSALEDGSSWTTGTNFAQRSLAPDPWRSMIVVNRYVWLLGEQTSEIWYDVGNSTQPFVPVSGGALIPYGIKAPHSARALGRDFCWLGVAGGGRISVLHVMDSTPETISTHPLESALSGYRLSERAVGDVYADAGHTFYLLHVPGEITWAWDSETKLWHERGTWADGRFYPMRARYFTPAFGDVRALDAEGSGLYRMGRDIGTDVDSLPIRRLRRAPALEDENRRIYYGTLELAFEPGLGNTVDPGSNPQAMLRASNDGGKTWGAEQWRSAAAIGTYDARMRWHRLGCARRRVLEVSVTDPTPWRLMGAYLTLGQPVKG